jgi:hypothetical protein
MQKQSELSSAYRYARALFQSPIGAIKTAAGVL